MALYSLAQAAARRWPKSVALRSQAERLVLDFATLERQAAATAVVLSGRGFEAGQTLVCDLQNVSQNVVLQLACSAIGVSYGTAKNDKTLAQLKDVLDVGGVVYKDDSSALKEAGLPGLSAADLIREASAKMGEDAVGGSSANHAFYNSASPLTNDQVMSLAADAAKHLELSASDTACISITLCHSFGIGTGTAACLSAGAAVSLPNVDGITGCGVPSERAAATMLALASDECTVLYADTHTLKALPSSAVLPKLRTGVNKVASGSDFLERSSHFAGVDLWTLGKRS